MNWTCSFCLLFNFIQTITCLCTYPTALRGTWVDSVYGNIEFGASWMNMQTKSFLTGITGTNFTCEIENGNIYVSKSTQTSNLGIGGGFVVNVWICFQMTEITASSFYYYLNSADQFNLNFGDVVPMSTLTTATQSDVCNTSPSVAEFHMLVNQASASTGLSKVPTPLLGEFTYTMNFGTGTTQCGSSAYWDGCTNTSVISLNNTNCGSQFVGYSASGYLGSVISVADTTNSDMYYVGIYNFDTSVNGASTKRFTCFTVQQFGDVTNVSQVPSKCTSSSSPSVLPTDGALLQLTTIVSCAPVSSETFVSIGVILAIVFSIFFVIFLVIVIGICLYRNYKRKHAKKIIIVPKQLPKGGHTTVVLSDTSTVVNKEILTEPKLLVKPIRNGAPQSTELQEWKQNKEFQNPEGRLKIVTKPHQPIQKIDTMKSHIFTQMREEHDRKRHSSMTIDRVKTNLERELRVISVLKAKQQADRDEMERETALSKMSYAASLAPPKSRMSQYIHDPQAKARKSSMRRNQITNGLIPTANGMIGSHDDTFNESHQRTSTPLSVQRPSSIDMVMSEANLSMFSVDLKPRANKTPKPQPDITVTRRARDTKRYPAIRELTSMPGDFQSFER